LYESNHIQGWKERPIFGKIRFMNYAGCKRKFKVDQFVSRYNSATTTTTTEKTPAAAASSKRKAPVKKMLSAKKPEV
jgi:deoxyribodipyrimidine photo-lyase